MNVRQILRISLILFLVFPFIFLFLQFRIVEGPDWAELWWAFKNSFVQALFSAVFSLLLGFWCMMGLMSLSGTRFSWLRPFVEIICLLPNFLPSLFVILASLMAVEPFPMGVPGIVLVHTVMNFGLVAVLLAGMIESKAGGLAELAYVEGASRWLFISRGLLPYLKMDIFLLGLFIFVVCFGSFAVPLIVGGGRGTTLEVLIYEKIRLSSEWGVAVLIAFLQSLFIFSLSLIVKKGQGVWTGRSCSVELLKSYLGLGVVFLFAGVYIWGYVQGFFAGLSMISTLYDLQATLFWNFLGTMAIGLTTGVLCFMGLLLIAYLWPRAWFGGFLRGYVAPSTALACFAILIVGPNEGWYPFVKIPLTLFLLTLTNLFRMGWEGELQKMEPQINVARLLGASSSQTFREILLPQISRRAGLLAGLAAVWACGDFAVSRILAHRDLSLAMTTETLMSGYRLHQATVLSVLVMLSGVICFIIFVGGGRVLGRKFTT